MEEWPTYFHIFKIRTSSSSSHSQPSLLFIFQIIFIYFNGMNLKREPSWRDPWNKISQVRSLCLFPAFAHGNYNVMCGKLRYNQLFKIEHAYMQLFFFIANPHLTYLQGLIIVLSHRTGRLVSLYLLKLKFFYLTPRISKNCRKFHFTTFVYFHSQNPYVCWHGMAWNFSNFSY